jgi:hypothetical protein
MKCQGILLKELQVVVPCNIALMNKLLQGQVLAAQL